MEKSGGVIRKGGYEQILGREAWDLDELDGSILLMDLKNWKRVLGVAYEYIIEAYSSWNTI